MRKVLAMIIVLLMVSSVALADDLTGFVAKWNSFSKHYGAPVLSSDMLDGDIFKGDSWRMTVETFGDSYKGIGVYSEDMENFFPLCAQAGMCIVDDYDGTALRMFLGDLLYAFMKVKAGETPPVSLFGYYTFSVQQKGNGYFFAMMGL